MKPPQTPKTPRTPKPPSKKIKPPPQEEDNAFWQSLRVYFMCVGSLALLLTLVMLNAPDAPAGGVCNGVGLGSILPPPLGTLSTPSIVKLWSCTKAYQSANWWFVLAFFVVSYVSIKSLAIPATFALCILAGAVFPMPLCQLITGLGEAIGSSLCAGRRPCAPRASLIDLHHALAARPVATNLPAHVPC